MGTWAELPGDNIKEKDSATWTITRHFRSTGLFKPDTAENAYNIQIADEKGKSDFIAHLFSLDGKQYIDFYPAGVNFINDLTGYHMVCTHSLARVKFSANVIIIHWYNAKWMVDLFNRNKIKIPHERVPYDIDYKNPDNEQVILTASTAELQKFVRKYGNDSQAFRKGNDITFVLVREKH